MPEILATIKVPVCYLNKVIVGTTHLYTKETWKGIWRDFPFCVKFAERKLGFYDDSQFDTEDKFAGIVTKIKIGKSRVWVTIDLLNNVNGNRIYTFFNTLSQAKRETPSYFCVNGEGSLVSRNGYQEVTEYKLRSIQFSEEPLIYTLPSASIPSSVSVTETDLSQSSNWNAPAGFDRGFLGVVGGEAIPSNPYISYFYSPSIGTFTSGGTGG